MSANEARVRRRPRPAIRREQIFEQAIRIIGQRGYHGFSVQELAESCGLTNAGLLYHFKSKDQLLIALLQDRDRRDGEAVTAAIERLPEESRPFSVFRAIVERNSIQPDLVRLYAILRAEALDRGHPAHDFFAAREATTFQAFEKMLAPYVPDPRTSAHQLLCFMAGLELQWLRADQGFDLVQAWEAGATLLLAGQRRAGGAGPKT